MQKENEHKPEEKMSLQIIPYKSKYMKIRRGNSIFYLDPTKYEISS
jgi:hypothetical protein